MRIRHRADCRVAVERAADSYTLICDGPLITASYVASVVVEDYPFPPGRPAREEAIVELSLGGARVAGGPIGQGAPS